MYTYSARQNNCLLKVWVALQSTVLGCGIEKWQRLLRSLALGIRSVRGFAQVQGGSGVLAAPHAEDTLWHARCGTPVALDQNR